MSRSRIWKNLES